MQTNSTHSLGSDEIERLRGILAAHDAGLAGGLNEFDLNKPPAVAYAHKAYPLHMTHKKGVVKIAADAKQAQELAQKGFLNPEEYRAHVATLPKPNPDADLDETDGLSADDKAEAAEMNEKLGITKPAKAKPAKAKPAKAKPAKAKPANHEISE